MIKNFKDQLAEIFDKNNNPLHETLKIVSEITRDIERVLSEGKTEIIHIDIKPGYFTKQGQQFILQFRKWKEVPLLRVYVPSSGFPMTVDLGDEQEECHNREEFEKIILKFFQKPEIDARLMIMREFIK